MFTLGRNAAAEEGDKEHYSVLKKMLQDNETRTRCGAHGDGLGTVPTARCNRRSRLIRDSIKNVVK